MANEYAVVYSTHKYVYLLTLKMLRKNSTGLRLDDFQSPV